MTTKLNWVTEKELAYNARLQNMPLERYLSIHSDKYALWENCPFAGFNNRVYKVMYENFDKVQRYLQ